MKGFKVLRQLEMTDCGPACIQMICLHYGKRHSLDFIKRDISISRIGVTVVDVKDACERLGLETVVAQGTVSQLTKAPLPVILHWRGNHFVVLYHVGRRRKGNIYYIADPSYGKIRFNERDFVRHWYGEDGRGFAVFTSPSQAFRQCNEVNEKQDFSVLKNFFSKFKKQKIKLLLALFCMLIAAGCNWVIPVLYQKVIDYGVIGQNLNVVWQLFLAQLSFFIGHMLSNSFSSILLLKLNFYVGIEYVAELLGKMIRLPIKYFDTRLNTDFIQRLDDYQRLQSILTYNAIDQIFAVINIVVCSLLLARYSVTSLVLFFVISILSFVWNLYFLRERKFLDYSRFTEQARNRNILYELINGMPDIKVNNAQETRVRVWMDNQNHINEITMKSLMLNYKQMVGSSTISFGIS
jgi:ATP-binding cassette subfamily B protein